MRRLALGWLLAGGTIAGLGQQVGTTAAPGPANPRLAAAERYIGRALILRECPAGEEPRYDAAGRIGGNGQRVDWTLAGMDLREVSEDRPGELLLTGVRVAIRYNPDNRQFERHPQKDEPLRVHLLEAADADGVQRAMDAVFSTGIDPALERSVPAFWAHYFLPGTPWSGEDALPGVAVAGVGGKLPPDAVAPVIAKHGDPEGAPEAGHDRVQGGVLLRMVVDAAGVPRRIVVARPLGYGLDARAVEAVRGWRFQPGTQGGQPVAEEATVEVRFSVPPPAQGPGR